MEVKYSFIIPFFSNDGDVSLLLRCVDSIPPRDDLEIIVVDNSRISVSFPGMRKEVRVLYSDVALGAGHARNVGIKAAKGEYLLFADADDFYDPSVISVVERALYPSCQVLYFNVNSDNGDRCSRGCILNEKFNEYYKNNRELIKFYMYAPWNKVVRRDFVEQESLAFEVRPSGNDAWFSLMVADKAKEVSFIPDVLYYLTDQPSSITFGKGKTPFAMLWPRVDLLARIDTYFKDHDLGELRTPLLSPILICRMIRQDGIKNTFKYCARVHRHSSFFQHLVLGVKKDCGRLFRKPANHNMG